MAPRPHQHKFSRQQSSRNHARDLAILRRAFSRIARCIALRVEARPTPQTRRIAPSRALLSLFALLANGRLQGPPHALAIPAILRRSPRRRLRHHIRDLPSALLDQHAALLGSRAAFPLCRPQRRDQHHRLEPPLAPRQTARTPPPPHPRLLLPP